MPSYIFRRLPAGSAVSVLRADAFGARLPITTGITDGGGRLSANLPPLSPGAFYLVDAIVDGVEVISAGEPYTGAATVPPAVNGGPLQLLGSAAGGFDSTDSTSRLGVQSYQTNGTNFFGEGVRLDLMRGIAKNMIAWRLPRPANNPDVSTLRSVTWLGAHYYAQDQPDLNNPTVVHGHWSLEVPDSTDSLRTRFEVRFVDAAGNLGVDKTLVQTANADLVVDCSNSQKLRLRGGPGAEKVMEFGNDEWGALPRWTFGVTPFAETGANSGSDLAFQRFTDAGVASGAPLRIKRSNGRLTFGDTDGSSGGADLNRNSAGVAFAVSTNFAAATGATAVGYTAFDATSRLLSSSVQAEPTARVVVFADGKHEWGAGTARDVNLYRKAVDQLGTDDAIFLGGQSTAQVTALTTPVGGGVLYVDAGALKFKGTSGTITTVALP